MPVRSRVFNATQGLTQIAHASLSGVRVLWVKRTGRGHFKVSSFTVPAGLQFRHIATSIRFSPDIPFEQNEWVWVLWYEP
jgi:hypothetical protein